jgi:hypothetical protein
MNEQKMSSRLFILTRFHEAYTKNSIHPRNKRRGQWTPDGWIPNTFWNGYDRAGLEGTAEVRRLIREFGAEWFESRSVKELKKYFGKNFYFGDANIEAKRVRPEKWNDFSRIAIAEYMIWLDKAPAGTHRPISPHGLSFSSCFITAGAFL